MLTALGPAMPVCMGRRLRQSIRDLLEDFDALDPLLFLKPTTIEVTGLHIRRSGATVYARLGLGGATTPVGLGSMVRLSRAGTFKVLHEQGGNHRDLGDTTNRAHPASQHLVAVCPHPHGVRAVGGVPEVAAAAPLRVEPLERPCSG